jgi:3-oxoacyl-[acyl-carrier-protein] synthase-3
MNEMRRAVIKSIRYTLGETERHYRDVPTFEEMTTRHSMPDAPDLFGWGSYFTTRAPIADLAVDAAAHTIESSGIGPNDIDVVFICSVNFDEAGSALYQTVLSKLALTRAFPIGVTLNDCTMLLSTLEMARALVAGGYENVLVISANRIEDEQYRFQKYALFSDGAVSCLVSSEPDNGCEILGSALRSSVQTATGADGWDDEALYRDTHESLLRTLNIAITDVDRVFCNNLFAPVVKIKEGRVGITQQQLFLDNIPRIAHCFSADPLINLSDCWSSGGLRDGALLMLTSDADGLRTQVGLRFRSSD